MPNDQAAETTVANKPIPLGGKILRKLKSELARLSDDATKMASEMETCEAKDAIGGLVGGLGTMTGDIGKHWEKYYKDHDIDAIDEPAPNPKADDGGEEEGDDVDAALKALTEGEEEDPNADEEANLTPAEKAFIERRIKVLEAEEAHYQRLEAMAK